MNTGWVEIEGTLTKTFTFTDFAEALAFVNSVGAIVERLKHHPDIAIKNYNTVTISTTTHDTGNTVTNRDRNLTEIIDKIDI